MADTQTGQGTKSCGCCWHTVLRISDYQSAAYLDVSPSGCPTTGGGVHQSFKSAFSRTQSAALCRHCFPLVHCVIRNRVGEQEDRFFSTVFLGSGLLYIAMIFTSAALAGGLIRVLAI